MNHKVDDKGPSIGDTMMKLPTVDLLCNLRSCLMGIVMYRFHFLTV